MLSKGEISSKSVRVEFPMEGMDMSGFQFGATYEEIKRWIEKEYGFKVPTLYIAQVKRKLGLPIGEHYNISKKDDQVVPQCPPEKEKAIIESLKHFNMI